jgi:hypothetical protein
VRSPSQTALPIPIPPEVLEAPAVGRNLIPGTFGDQLAERTLIVFLRHLG